jgi:hypothetical protein
MIENPFTLGNIMPGGPFCNRRAEIAELCRYAHNGDKVVMYSARQIGKTSLVRRVADQLEKKGFLPVYVDLFAITAKDDFIDKFAAGVVRATGDVTSPSVVKRVKNLFSRIVPNIEVRPESISISARFDQETKTHYLIEDIFEGIERHTKAKRMRCLIIFDEFQEIEGLPESKEIEGLLRDQLQTRKLLSCFFVGSRRRVLQGMFTDSKRPFYRAAFSMELGRISEDEMVDYLMDLFSKSGKKCPRTLAQELYQYVTGHTYYVQKLGHMLWDSTATEVTAQSLESAKKKLLQMQSPDFMGVFGGLARMEKRLLVSLSVEPTAQPYSRIYLSRHGFSIGGMNKSINSLTDRDLIERTEGGLFQVTDPIFAKWCILSRFDSAR